MLLLEAIALSFSWLHGIPLYDDTTIYLSSLLSFHVAFEGICQLRVWANDVSLASPEARRSGERETRKAFSSCLVLRDKMPCWFSPAEVKS